MIHDAALRRLLQAEAEISAVRSQGPGGQNVNKVSSAAQLRFDVLASSLPEAVKARLLNQADQRISAEGVIVIKAQQHRSLPLNRAEALQRLTEMVQAAQQVPRTRHATRPTRASVQRRLQSKLQHGQLKALRRARLGTD